MSGEKRCACLPAAAADVGLRWLVVAPSPAPLLVVVVLVVVGGVRSRVGRRRGRAPRFRPATTGRTSSPPPAWWAPRSEGVGRSAEATEPLASSPCGAREPGPPSAAARLSPPTGSCARSAARARTPMPRAPAARCARSRRPPRGPRPTPPYPFREFRRPFARKRSAELAHEHQHQHQHQHEAVARTDAPESVTSDDDSLRPSSAFAVDADPRCLVLWAAPLSACSP